MTLVVSINVFRECRTRFVFERSRMHLDQHTETSPNFRLDVPLHDLLTKSTVATPGLLPHGKPQTFPDPIFPQYPELLGPIDGNDGWVAPERRKWTPGQIYHAMQGWLFPYIRSRVTAGDFHPLISYLFTEFKCNLDCHYCWAFDNKVNGMSEDTPNARSTGSIARDVVCSPTWGMSH